VALVDQLTRRSAVSAAATFGEPMINVVQARSELAALPGDSLVIPKAQYAQMLTELETGQHARRALTNLQSFLAIAASTSGAPV